MKPMLASPAKDIKFPVYASPKIDGVRAYVRNHILNSRSGKPIRNAYTQNIFGKGVLEGLDGELCVGNPWDKNLMQQTTSGVMSREGQPNVCWYVFDVWTLGNSPYESRLRTLEMTDSLPHYVKELYKQGNFRFLEQTPVLNQKELDTFEAKQLALGYEGIMLRDPRAPYKYGRSTAKEGYLLKVKRWTDGEARIVGFNQFQHNANELFQDEFGYAKRSSHQENKIGMDMLGSFVCVDLKDGTPIDIGTGYTMAQRKDFWERRDSLLNSIVKYKHFAQAGVKDANRFPVFVGFRDKDDM